MSQFIEGLKAPINGAQMFLQIKGLWKWACAPIAIYLLVLWAINSTVSTLFWGWVASFKSFFDGLGVWLSWIYVVFYAFSGVVYGLVLLYTVFLIVKVLASPFLGIIAEKTLVHLDQDVVSPANVKEWMAHTLKMMASSLREVLYFVGIGLVLFAVSFIPGMNLLSALGFMIILAFDCTVYSLEAKGLKYKDRIEFMKKNLAAYIGFGISLSILFFIPGLNVLLFPFAVSGGSYLISKL